MRRAWFLLLCALGPHARAEPIEYTLDPAHSFAYFELLHFGTSTIRGRIGPLSGGVMLDRSAAKGSVGLAIATATVDTGVKAFDARIREPDLLASAAFAQAYFVAERFRFDGDRLTEVRGEFTLRGVSRPLSLNALRFGCYQSPQFQREVCGGDFAAEFDRSEFGIHFGLPFVGNRVRLLIQVEGVSP